MSMHMPQEIEVWYVLPALRKEVAKVLVEKHSLSQKQVAGLLHITESAVSQYLRSKRAQEISFTKSELGSIQQAAANIVKDPKHIMKHMYDLSVAFRGSKTICKLHKKYGTAVPRNCDICL